MAIFHDLKTMTSGIKIHPKGNKMSDLTQNYEVEEIYEDDEVYLPEELTQEELANDLKNVQLKIEVLKKEVEIGSALNRLKENKDFQLVIETEYLEREANRLFEILTESQARRENIENTKDRLEAIRYLNLFIGTKSIPGSVASNAARAKEYLSQEEELEKKMLSAME